MSRVVVLAVLALAACASPGEEAAREACAGGNAGACQAVAAADQSRAMALASGMQSMGNSFNQAAARPTPATTNCRFTSTWVGAAPSGMTCTGY